MNPQLYEWVKIGAEEEGVPCRQVVFPGEDLVSAAYAAAQGSRLGVGVAVGHSEALLHEAHMPAGQPVWRWQMTGGAPQVCRLAGTNAGQFVKRMPLRFEFEEAAANVPVKSHPALATTFSPEAQAGLTAALVRVLERRGLL